MTWTPQHLAAAERWWNAYVGGPIDWTWLKRPDQDTLDFLALTPEQAETLYLDLPPRIVHQRKSFLARLWSRA